MNWGRFEKNENGGDEIMVSSPRLWGSDGIGYNAGMPGNTEGPPALWVSNIKMGLHTIECSSAQRR